MNIARQHAAPSCPPVQAPNLSVVAPGQGLGAMPTSDELNHLIGSVAAAADRRAFAALFKHFAPRVKAYLIRSGTPADIAEELAQEAMVTVWRKAAAYDPQRAQLSTWIYTIARNLRIDEHRRHGDESLPHEALDVEALAVVDAQETPEERALSVERERGIRQALAQLPADQALVLQLSFYQGQPHAQIARELALPLGTVKSRIRLAVGRLRELLDRFEP
jgi:RNA polymerase sigma-70 factor (ECF subfamily)